MRVVSLTNTVAVAMLLSCGSSPQKTNQVTVSFGVVTDQTGSVGGPTQAQAATQAVTDFNAGLAASTSFQNLKFSANIQDSVSTPSVAVARARATVDAGAVAVITDTTADALGLNILFYQPDAGGALNVPIIGTEATSPFLNNPATTLAQAGGNPFLLDAYQNDGGWFFRTAATSNLVAVVLTRIALSYGDAGDVDNDGVFTEHFYTETEPFGLGMIAAMENANAALAPDAGVATVQIDLSQKPNPATYNFTADLQSLLMGSPDVIIDVTFPAFGVGLVKFIATQPNVTTRVLHTHAFHFSQVLVAVGPAGEGQEGASYVLAAPTPSGATFTTEMQQQQNVAAEIFDAQHYDAAALVMLAVLYAAHANHLSDPSQVTGEMVKAALSHLNDPSGDLIGVGPSEVTRAANDIASGKAINYDGASGPCDFDQYGNVLSDITHFKITNGQFKDMEKYDCVSNPATCPLIP